MMELPQIKKSQLINFVNTITLSTGKGTFYTDSSEEQEKQLAIHRSVMEWDRELYSFLLCLEDVQDRHRQLGVYLLLNSGGKGFLYEDNVLSYLVRSLPPQRSFKLFLGFKHKVNNSRMRYLVSHYIFNSSQLQLWSVKYRSKLKEILTHIWGRQYVLPMRKILEKYLITQRPVFSKKEMRLWKRLVGKYVVGSFKEIHENLFFILGGEEGLTLPLLREYIASKRDLSAGKNLPYEVLEGIRSTYHPHVPNSEVLKIVKGRLTVTQQKNFQRKGKQEGTEIEFNPDKYDMTSLYIFSFEKGEITSDVNDSLVRKARQISLSLKRVFPYQKIGILLDTSYSMRGSRTQKMKPIAVSLALRNILEMVRDGHTSCHLLYPQGGTDLASPLVNLVESGGDEEAIFVISDGYENQPAGRFGEVVSVLRKLGYNVPIYHLNPVSASETIEGVRSLAKEVFPLGVTQPEKLSQIFLRSVLYNDPVEFIRIVKETGLEKVKKLRG